MRRQRQARVKAQWVKAYPGVDPAHWYPAIVLAEHVNKGRDHSPNVARPERDLSPEHFEFRGADARDGEWTGSRRGEVAAARRRSG